jgi:hypothetical protein
VLAPRVWAVWIFASAAAMASLARSVVLAAAAGAAMAKVIALEARSDTNIDLRSMVFSYP